MSVEDRTSAQSDKVRRQGSAVLTTAPGRLQITDPISRRNRIGSSRSAKSIAIPAMARPRHLVMVGSVLAHAVLLAVLLRVPSVAPMAAERGLMTVSLYDGQAAPLTFTPRRQTPIVPPISTRKIKVRLTSDQSTDVAPQYVDASASPTNFAQRDPLQDPVALSVAAASGAGAPACHLTEWLQHALQADPQVEAALLIIPRPARSISNALMLWDGSWVEVQLTADAGVAAIRSAVVSGIRAAPVSCRTQFIRGPEFMTLTSGSDTTVMAIGSGEWRWEDLLSPLPGVTSASAIVQNR